MRIPDGHMQESTAGMVVAVCWGSQVAVYQDFDHLRPEAAVRVAGWLEGWAFAKAHFIKDLSASYLILQLGGGYLANETFDRYIPEGIVGVGYGSEPAAPPDAEDIELPKLVSAIVECLLEGTVIELDGSSAFPW